MSTRVTKTSLFSLLLVLLISGLMSSDHIIVTANSAAAGESPISSHVTNGLVAEAFIPLIRRDPFDPGPPLPPAIAHTGTAPLDFDTIQAGFQAKGHDLAFSKIGFHLGSGGNPNGYVDWLTSLDAAGVPFFIKSANDAGRLDPAIDIAKASEVPHTIVFRQSGTGYDIPDYGKSPANAAAEHWLKHTNNFASTNLDREIVWLETINEVDKNQADWLGDFALETAELALRDGYRWAAFGWSSGEPEPYHWETPSMLEFLRLAGNNPDQLAIALHEYGLTDDDLGNIYPWLVGRLQKLFEVCDKYNIPRPTVLITEFGWTYNNLPTPSRAMEQLEWAAYLYASYPTVRGAALWYLGCCFSIEHETQALIAPVTEYSLVNYFEFVPGVGRIDSTLFDPPPWQVPDESQIPGITTPIDEQGYSEQLIDSD